MFSARTARLIAAIVASTLAACGKSDSSASGPLAPGPKLPQPAVPVATYVIALSSTTMIAPAEGSVPEPPTVVVRDQFGGQMANVVVTFSDTNAGNGSVIDNPRVLTDLNGVATCGRWIVSARIGTEAVFASITGVQATEFDALVVPADPPGVRYDLASRGGMSLYPGVLGWLVLSDSTYSLHWIWGLGKKNPYVLDIAGAYTRRDTTFTFVQDGNVWASAVLQGAILTFTYDDPGNCGSPCMEVYSRAQPSVRTVSFQREVIWSPFE